ncbi:transposase [Nonomuraea pusilla]|uniref:transposase n=1 Tax=Nonomuraea pusilla TaxID=46177 RepID=UPI003D9F5753
MKSYPPEFRADAVALYLSDPGRTLASVAEDLGISRETLRNWVRQAQAEGTAGAKARGPARKPARGPLSSDDVLEAENKQLKARIRRCSTSAAPIRFLTVSADTATALAPATEATRPRACPAIATRAPRRQLVLVITCLKRVWASSA